VKISCQLPALFERFLQIIPSALRPEEKKRPADFSRQRKLPLPRLFVLLLSLAGGGRTEGVEIETASLFKLARRCGLWPKAQPAGRSAVSKGRAKISWTAFRTTLERAVDLADELWPERPGESWHGMTVLAVDGSKFNLPATEEIRQAFDPNSGFEHPGKGHYPQCLVSTLYDVFRRLPLARSIAPCHSCERQEALKLLRCARERSLVIFDRGYPSYEMFLTLTRQFAGHFLMRCGTTSTFPVVHDFLKSGKTESIIRIPPSYEYRRSATPQERETLPMITLRAIRACDPENTEETVLLTSLLDMQAIPRQEIVDLYYKRWEVEVYYREEKVVQEVQRFHSRTLNGIQQELFAVAIMTVISRTMAVLSEEAHDLSPHRIQQKNAVVALAREAAILAPSNPRKALGIFEELLQEIARIKYYPPKNPRPTAPRISKAAKNKWVTRRQKAQGP
jgi:hypothetical protein